ncbi:MAG: hypothetical protein H6585_07135 [Flavobacteriales bacterium]|nr:hypothetical protein [Flavobacteriales bacterium]MCB9448100.1 hypothetical protein [Flavobacteriales bacterium]
MQTKGVHLLNIGLIAVSLILACLLPFELFLIAFAILGPLHYLTEISWLEQRQYFVGDKRWFWLFAVLALAFALPYLLQLPFLSDLQEHVAALFTWINAAILIAFVTAGGLVFTKKPYQLWITIGMAVILAVLLRSSLTYNIWMGLFLPSVVHVYVFTGLFMLFGVLKDKSQTGMISILCLAAVPLVISFIPVRSDWYHFSDLTKQAFLDTRFHILGATLGKWIGTSNGKGFFFYEVADLKVQIFIAFAYLYHYLNWFSKTTVIGWHKGLTKKRSLIILMIWLTCIALFAWNYRIGILSVTFLSTLHIFVEFPLNMVSIRSIAQVIGHRVQTQTQP